MLRRAPEEKSSDASNHVAPQETNYRAGQIPLPAQFQQYDDLTPSIPQTSNPLNIPANNPIIALTIKQWLGMGGAKGLERFTRPIVLALLVYFAGYFAWPQPGITASILTGVNILLVLLSGAASISGERESKTWDAVRLTRIGTARIILGKWFSAAFPAIVTQAFFALILLISPVAKSLGWQNWLLVQAIMGATTLFAAALSVHVSSTAATVQKAQSGTAIAAIISTLIGAIVNVFISASNPILFVGMLISPGNLRSFVDSEAATVPGWMLVAVHIVAAAVLYLITLGQLAKPEVETIPTDNAPQRLEELLAKHTHHVDRLPQESKAAAISAPLQVLLLGWLMRIPYVSEHPLLAKELRSILQPAGSHNRDGSLIFIVVGGLTGIMLGTSLMTSLTTQNSTDNLSIWNYFGMTVALWISMQMAATSIPREREKQTWNAMLLSRISLREIVVSKVIAACVPALSIILAMLPMVIINALARGIGLYVIFTAPVLMIGTLMLAGSIGMLLGAINRSSRTASLQAALVSIILLASPYVGRLFLGFTSISDVFIGFTNLLFTIIVIVALLGFTALFGLLAIRTSKHGPREFDA